VVSSKLLINYKLNHITATT